MMKIAVFSTKPYDREFLASANDKVHELRFFEPRLTTRDSKSKIYRHSGSLKHRSMSKAYNAIIDTTPNTIKYSIFVYLICLLMKNPELQCVFAACAPDHPGTDGPSGRTGNRAPHS